VTFSARKVTTRLIDGEIILRTRKVNSRDQSKGTVIRLLKGDFTSQGLLSLHLRIATSLRISLFNQIAFHYKILSQAIYLLQEKSSLWYMNYQVRNEKKTGGINPNNQIPNAS